MKVFINLPSEVSINANFNLSKPPNQRINSKRVTIFDKSTVSLLN